jgi:hypothetical protein
MLAPPDTIAEEDSNSSIARYRWFYQLVAQRWRPFGK